MLNLYSIIVLTNNSMLIHKLYFKHEMRKKPVVPISSIKPLLTISPFFTKNELELKVYNNVQMLKCEGVIF